jgi:hemolysin activation/secretion protein
MKPEAHPSDKRKMRLNSLHWAVAVWSACLGCGAALAADPVKEPTLAIEVRQFSVDGDSPLSPEEIAAILQPHLGTHSSLDSLEAAPVALEKELRKRGYVFHRVIIPAQRPENGVVKLQVLKYTLNNVEVTGNQFFSSENILHTLPDLKTGVSPDVREIASEMAIANRHPSKRITLVIKESPEPQALDAEVRVRDVSPRQTFVSLTGHSRDENNEINDGTGYHRLTFGHQEANLFGLDHVLTATYTTSPDHVSDVSQFGLFYWIPVYSWHSSLSAYATYSDVDVGSLGVGLNSFNVSGRGEFFGVRLDHSFRKINLVNHGVSVALDHRHFESDVSTAGGGLPTSEVTSRPLSLRYFANTDQEWGSLGGYIEGLVNLTSGKAGDEDEYELARVGADSSWHALRYGIDAKYLFQNGWQLGGTFRGQYSDEPLIPGEQFGLGGDGSVRGLRDREIAGDRGYTVNLELHTPEIAAGLTPLVFIDHGGRRNVESVVGTPDYENATSLGVGVRWKTQNKLEVSADLAQVTNGIDTEDGTPSGHTKLHFSLFYRF